MKNWFEGVRTMEELKAAYRKLAKEHHPDHGGSEEEMQQINAQFDELHKRLPKTNAKGETYQPRQEDREAPEAFRAAVIAAMDLEGVSLELCGNWLWATGNTKPHKERLKAAGYRWSEHKSAWYWHQGGFRKRSKRQLSLDEIRLTFGSESIRASRDSRDSKERLSA